MGKQPVAWKEYYAEYCLKELQESMDRCTGLRDINEILLNKIQSRLEPFRGFVVNCKKTLAIHNKSPFLRMFSKALPGSEKWDRVAMNYLPSILQKRKLVQLENIIQWVSAILS